MNLVMIDKKESALHLNQLINEGKLWCSNFIHGAQKLKFPIRIASSEPKGNFHLIMGNDYLKTVSYQHLFVEE